jgi:hypothetical protein
MIAGNGNPTASVTTLIAQLQANGAMVLYHDHFDAAGLAICARLYAAGITPWRMTADDYRSTLSLARRSGHAARSRHTRLPTDAMGRRPPLAFNSDHRIVHEELPVDDILAAIRS